MSSNSGQPVSTGRGVQRPESDMDRLIVYMETAFPERRGEMLDLLNEVKALKSKNELVVLGIQCLGLIAELDIWIEIARDQIDSSKGSELAISREMGSGPGRRLADEVKAQAAAQISPLITIHNVLKSTRDSAKGIQRYCTTLLQTIRDNEFGEMFEQDADLTPIFDASLASTLNRARNAAG